MCALIPYTGELKDRSTSELSEKVKDAGRGKKYLLYYIITTDRQTPNFPLALPTTRFVFNGRSPLKAIL